MSDMYGIVLCTGCKRKRIADLKKETSQCPYCNVTSRVSQMKILFSDADQNIVRKAFESADPQMPPKKKRTTDPDPMSTLMYEYEHTAGALEKLIVLARGLDKIKGIIAKSDVEEMFPGKGEKMLAVMTAEGIIIEYGDGTYRAA